MNWPRARLWLIVAFLALDVLLAYVLFSDRGLPYFGQAHTSRRLSEQLARYGLTLQASLPPDPGPLPLQGLDRLRPPEWLIPTVYPDGAPIPEAVRTAAGGTKLTYRGDGVLTTVEPNGRVSVYYWDVLSSGSGDDQESADGMADGAGEPAETGTMLDTYVPPVPDPPRRLADGSVRAALLQAAEAWASSWGGLPDDRGEPRARYDPETGHGMAMWRQQMAGLPLYGSYLQVTMAGAPDGTPFEPGHWEWRWFRPLGPVGDPRPTVPAQTALLRLAGHLESIGASGGTITAVTLGYYTGQYEAETWEVPPVWRLELADGRYFYVNALTGELEAD